MSYKEFTKWLRLREGADIFGFEKSKGFNNRKNQDEEKPIRRFNLQMLMDLLEKHEINQKTPYVKFTNEIHWGSGTGSLRVTFGTKLNLIVEKNGIDLDGIPRWFTKRVYQIDPKGYGGNETGVAQELVEVLKEVDQQPLEAAAHNYNELEDLVVNMAQKMRKTARDIFLYEGVMKTGSDSYIIRFGLRAGGVEHQDQTRVLENQTHITYDKQAGVIRVFNSNLQSKVGSAPGWEIVPSDNDWYFAPSQSKDEIVETMANIIHWY